MKQLYYIVLAFVLHCTAISYSNYIPPQEPTNRGPKLQEPGLLTPQYAITLRAGDFNAGPVVITEPGYYVLSHDIVFNPKCPNSNDICEKPWQAAIIILSDNVTLDLNTHSIQQLRTDFGTPPSPYYSPNFKLIQLGGQNVFQPNNTTIYNPKHVVIKNGSLNGSQGYGIYGKNNVNIQLYDLMICECDIAGIFLENLKCSSISDSCIAGSPYGTGNVYGIFLRDSSTSSPEWTSDSQGASGPSGVKLENIKICDICTDGTLATGAEILILLQCALNKLDITEFVSAANNPNLTPSIALIAQMALMLLNNFITAINTAVADPTLANIQAIIDIKNNLLLKLDELILAICLLPCPTPEDICLKNATINLKNCLIILCDIFDEIILLFDDIKDYINGIPTTVSWNAYGIRIVNGSGIECHDCFVTGTCVKESLATPARAAGIALDSCEGVTLYECTTNGSFVNLGQSIGYSIATHSSGNYLLNCISTSHASNDETYGYWLCFAHSNKFTSCESSSNDAVTAAKGFYLERSNANSLDRCKSFCHICKPISSGNKVQSIGFESIGSDCNIFDFCQAYSMIADQNFLNSSYFSPLLAAGFRLRSYPDTTGPIEIYDKNSVITNSTTRCNEGSAGIAAGILLDGAVCSTVKKNMVATSSSLKLDGAPDTFTVGGNGYGILDKASDSLALIIENLAYANQTANYKVSYALENEQLPVVVSTYGDMTSVYVASPWANISINPNPGTTGCYPACLGSQEFFDI